MDKKTFTCEVGGKTLTIETSAFAEQANAAVIARYGETIVLATAVMGKKEATTDYLPLRVDYEERFYAAGKILGSRFMRREGRPSEDAILTGRLIDRTLRPLFNQNIRRDIQVVVTVLSYDGENEPDFVGLVAASTALYISDIPWGGPVAAVRVAKLIGAAAGSDMKINPTNSEMKERVFETFAAGPKDRISMIELAGEEAKEEDVITAFGIAQKEINELIAFQDKIRKEIGVEKKELALFTPDAAMRAAAEEFLASRAEAAIYHTDKAEHEAGLAKLKADLFAHLTEVLVTPEKPQAPNLKAAEFIFEEVIDKMVHDNILNNEKRPDLRKVDELRELKGEIGLFNRTHGSSFFARGSTQALAITTLGAPGGEQLIEGMQTSGKRRFMLHYNFPPYSVGEVGMFRGPGRREIGHGELARKALIPMMPTSDIFPYAVRVVSEILSSNGSSSMATVCATTLSLMDAGVPIKKPVAGIAMGLMMTEDGSKFKVLTDLAGAEDHYGDMDFKVAGTEQGVNAIQLDVKVHGLTPEIIAQTLKQSRDARLKILGFMKTVIEAPRPKLSVFAPTIITLKINPEKIGMVIGPGGKMINGLIKMYALETIDIDEDGSVFISADKLEKAEQAAADIRALTKDYTIGEIIEGPVIKILDFGAIVDLGGGKDGMIHVSELKDGFVKAVTEVLKVGDHVRAVIIRVDTDGHIGLSLKRMKEDGMKA
jgi:polyribonucleotide nucleotidyltransferase